MHLLQADALVYLTEAAEAVKPRSVYNIMLHIYHSRTVSV